MYEIEGPAARSPVLRPGCPSRADRRPCCRASDEPPTRSRSPARCSVVAGPRTCSRGPPIASTAAVLVRRAPAAARGLPLTLTGGVDPEGLTPREPAPKNLLPGPPIGLGVAGLVDRAPSGGPRSPAALPPPESPPSGPPVVLGVGVVLRALAQGAQGVPANFLGSFRHPQDVHSLSSGGPPVVPTLSPDLCTEVHLCADVVMSEEGSIASRRSPCPARSARCRRRSSAPWGTRPGFAILGRLGELDDAVDDLVVSCATPAWSCSGGQVVSSVSVSEVRGLRLAARVIVRGRTTAVRVVEHGRRHARPIAHCADPADPGSLPAGRCCTSPTRGHGPHPGGPRRPGRVGGGAAVELGATSSPTEEAP